MTPEQIKQAVLALLVLAVLGGGWLYGWYWHSQFISYHENIEMQLQQNILDKQLKEQEDARKTKAIVDNYESINSVLAHRLSELGTQINQPMPRESHLFLSGDRSGCAPVPKIPATAGGVDAPVKVIPNATWVVDAASALADTNQCEKLQEWVKEELKP